MTETEMLAATEELAKADDIEIIEHARLEREREDAVRAFLSVFL